MKNFLPYFKFSTISLILSIILSLVFNFSLLNSWQAGVTLLFVVGPYWIYGWKQAVANKKRYPILCLIARFYLILWLVGSLIAAIILHLHF